MAARQEGRPRAESAVRTQNRRHEEGGRMSSIKLAWSTLAAPEWSLAQMIDATKRYGFDGIEFRLLDGEVIPPDISAENRERVETECKAAGIPICCVDTSIRVAQSATDPDMRL